MKKLLLALLLYSFDCHSQSAEELLISSINLSIDSFSKINCKKHKQIRGIYLEFDSSNHFSKFKLSFSSKETKLSLAEYRWLFNYLNLHIDTKFLIDERNLLLSDGKIKISLPYTKSTKRF
ncbi:MAG: hypothetical protein KA797_01510 [Chitinophagales bacterium]|nr:hypothetical protein [Chitinophagales bacterium]